MCGICGISVPPDAKHRMSIAAVERMCQVLVHRGPDDLGLWCDKAQYIGLGHRRLSIVDIASGHQPMTNETNDIWLVFNGEIYNHRELRRSLEQRGYRYRSTSDTETILHLYEEEGVWGVKKLRGMFAYAIWDSIQSRLLLVRDRMGIKPLYYVLKDDGTLYFASEIKALLEVGAVSPSLNYSVFGEFLANRSTAGEQTLYRGIYRLLPGHVLEWKDGKIAITSYWDLDFHKPVPVLNERQYVSKFLDIFRDSVRVHLMSDVPLGMFLSGGIDSSAIAAIMSELSHEPIKTFSVAFAESEANELEYARAVAEAFNTDHHEIIVNPHQFFEVLPTLVYQEDEPIAHPSSVPLFFVSKLARKHVKVVLTGEGSDELLAGYNKYRVAVYNMMLGRQYIRFIPESIRHFVQSVIHAQKHTIGIGRILARTFLAHPPDLQHLYFDNFAVYPSELQDNILSNVTKERMQERDPYRSNMRYWNSSGADTILDRLLAVDLKSYLQELLMKQDQMSMAASIESRVPFLDHELVEFATQLPTNMKLRGFTTKYVLRRAMAGILPENIIKRKKMGFPVPIGSWLRGEFRWVLDEYVLGERSRARGLFDQKCIQTLIARHYSGENHSEQLWMLINLEIWMRRFLDGDAATPDSLRISEG